MIYGQQIFKHNYKLAGTINVDWAWTEDNKYFYVKAATSGPHLPEEIKLNNMPETSETMPALQPEFTPHPGPPLLDFGTALSHGLKQGKRIQRTGWNGKGLFVFMQVPAEIGMDVIPKMQSLPDSTKTVFAVRGNSIKYSNQMALVDVDNNITGWAPSASDTLAEDWIILD